MTVGTINHIVKNKEQSDGLEGVVWGWPRDLACWLSSQRTYGWGMEWSEVAPTHSSSHSSFGQPGPFAEHCGGRVCGCPEAALLEWLEA